MSVAIENYRYDTSKLYTSLIQSSLPRKLIPGWNESLSYLRDEVYRKPSVIDSSNPQVREGGAQNNIRYATFRTTRSSLNISKIEESIGYSNPQLAQLAGSELPFDGQVRRIVEKFGETEERLFFAGDPLLSSSSSIKVTDTTNASTSITTSIDLADTTDPVGTVRQGVGGAVGQLIDTYKEKLKQYPIYAVWSPDCYKLLVNMSNQYTDNNVLELVTKDLKMVGAETGMMNHNFMSPYLFGNAGALDLDGDDVVLETTGTRAFALICGDPNSMEALNSSFYQQAVAMPRGMDVDLGESVLFDYNNNDAIIYDNAVAIA